MLSRLRLVAIIVLAGVLGFRLMGVNFGEFGFGDIDINPSPVVDPEEPVWLVVVEEKSDRPEGMAAFERSELRRSLPAKKVSYRNFNDDDPDDLVQKFVRALGGDIPGYMLVRSTDGKVVQKGKIPEPVELSFFEGLMEDIGR